MTEVAIRDVVILSLVILWVLYWRASAQHTKATKQRESRRSRLVHLIPLLTGCLLAALPSVPLPILSVDIIPDSSSIHWAGVFLVACGLGFSAWARHHLGRNWSGMVTLKEGHELIQTGPYRLVRHPIYMGVLLALVGCTLAYGELRGMLGVSMVALSMIRKLRIEERFMQERFNGTYEHYKRHTAALIPFVY
jgi:protein-S-isoprenylcysteine O-methyltransferase Ste14